MIACGDVRACSRDEVVQGMEGLRERQPFTHLFFFFFSFFLLPPNFRYLHLRWGYRRADHPTTSPAGASYNHTRAVPLVTLFARVKAAETVCTAPTTLFHHFSQECGRNKKNRTWLWLCAWLTVTCSFNHICRLLFRLKELLDAFCWAAHCCL